jgi:molybdopterin-guanine dinucleotide biosynthesis protein A
LADLRKAVLEEGVRKVEDFARRHKTADLPWHRGGSDPFLNINTPADLAQAERRLAR